MSKSKDTLGRTARNKQLMQSIPKPPRMTLIRHTTKEEKVTMRAYSNSRLEAVNMCPMWGIVSSKKRYSTSARSMALEAGSAMHEVFAAERIWQLRNVQNLPKHADVTADRIFGKARWAQITRAAKTGSAAADSRNYLLDLLFAVLHTSGWKDAPYDKNRTMQNMELAAIEYVNERYPHMENWPIYVEDFNNAKCMVGIEQVFDIIIEYEDGTRIRYIGTVDGLVIKAVENIHCLDENKTAARLDDGWRSKFELAHQITGYCAAGSLVFGFPVLHSRVTGVKIGRGENAYALEPIARDEQFNQTWAKWVYHTTALYEAYQDNFEEAPRYTHSCNRFFRPCSLIPFCSDTMEGRQVQWDNMDDAHLSPSEQAIMDKMS